MNILVTGGAGYIGSHTCLALKDAGHKVVVLDTLERGHKSAITADTFIQGNISDSDLVENILLNNRVDIVLHFSAYAYVEESVKEPAKYFKNNVSATLRLLDAMIKCRVLKFVFSSSCATYGIPDKLPITEDTLQIPVNPYGFTKLAVERALEAYHHAYGLSYVALRYFNAAGADAQCRAGEDHRPETHVIPLLLNAAFDGTSTFKVYGTDYDTPDGSCIRDYIHVSDLADAHERSVEIIRDNLMSLKLNLGTGHGYSVLELIEATKKVTGRIINVDINERRMGDPPVLVASCDRAYEILNWKPKYSDLDNIIETALKWKLANPKGYEDESK